MHTLNAIILAASACTAAVIPRAELEGKSEASSWKSLFARTVMPPICVAEQQYKVDSKTGSQLSTKSFHGSVTCTGAYTHLPCSLSHSNTYSVSVGISVGGSLALDFKKIFTTAGLDASYTYTTTTGTVDGGAPECPPGPWTCALKITPYVSVVTGTTWIYENGYCGGPAGNSDEQLYQVEFPETRDNGPDVHLEVCTCPNNPGADTEGAPPLCLADC